MDEAAIERERQVILREMSEVNKNQEELVLDHLHATAFQGTSLGRTILGSEENIKSLTRADLQDYIKTNYTAPRMVLAGAGAVDHAQLTDLAAQYFGGLPSTAPGGVDVAMEPAVFTGSDYRYVPNDVATSWSILVFRRTRFGGSAADWYQIVVAFQTLTHLSCFYVSLLHHRLLYNARLLIETATYIHFNFDSSIHTQQCQIQF
jgi:predicted Zn-dependent peptidase